MNGLPRLKPIIILPGVTIARGSTRITMEPDFMLNSAFWIYFFLLIARQKDEPHKYGS